MNLRTALTSLVMLVSGLVGVCSAAPLTAPSNTISIGERFELQSQVIAETRPYFVHRPADYDLSNARYPVLIVLDAEDDFQFTSATADFLAAVNRIPAMLVVGIPNTNRFRDLVPFTPQSGTANFLKFIQTELLPKIDHDYRTQPYRVLAAHSNGGLFGLCALISAPEVFKGYVLASPALGAEDRELPKTVDSYLQQHKDIAASLYMTLANETEFLSSVWELSSYLQNQAARDPRWSFAFQRHPDETHGSVQLRTLYDGLSFVFDGWNVPDPFALYEANGGIAGMEKHYKALSSRLGFDVPVPRDVLLQPAYSLYRQKRTDEAERLILHTIEVYPSFTTPYLMAGRLYFDRGDKAKAVEYLKKSLQLLPTARATGVNYAALNLDPKVEVPVVQLSASELQKFVGGYGSSAPALAIVRRDSKLFAVTGSEEHELTAMSATRFYYTQGGELLTFRRDEHGRVIGLTLQYRAVELARLR